MELLIDIPDKAYKRISEKSEVLYSEMIILNGTPLADLTNGEVMMKMFPKAKITEETYVVFMNIEECNHPFDKAWWNRKWGE